MSNDADDDLDRITNEIDEAARKSSENEDKDGELGRISANLLSQESDLQDLKQELATVNEAFAAFKQDYSQLLTLYNETNDQLQEMLHERSLEDNGRGELGLPTSEQLADFKEQIIQAEIERDKYQEMYLQISQHAPLPASPQHDHDTAELQEQIRDMVDQVQELELVRDEMALRVQQQAAEKDEMMDQMSQIKVVCDQLETEHLQQHNHSNLYQEQLNVKNTIIEKLRSEFTELGDENTKLRADISKFVDSKEKQERLIDYANLNQDDLVKDYQALQYRCTETERREQEALLYIKDCLKLVEQTQHEKEQLIIQAAQSENMRAEIELTLSGIVEEAGKRTVEEVGKIRRESNKKISQLIQDTGEHQEHVAELEAKIEEMERERILAQINGNTQDEVALADKDAVIYKLKEHIDTLQQDKTNLTDQLLEVSNTMRLTKEHFETKLLGLSNQLSANKEKVSRLTQDNKLLYEEKDRHSAECDVYRNNEKTLRHKIQELKSILVNTEKRTEEEVTELKQDEESRRELLRRAQDKLVNHLRGQVLDKQNEVNKAQETLSQTQFVTNNKESELQNTIINLTKKAKETSAQYKQVFSDLEKSREMCSKENEKRYKLEARLKAVNMQLHSANSQIELVTENEAKLCSKQKELQLRIDQQQFELQRNKSSQNNALNYNSNLGSLIIQSPAHKAVKDKKSACKKREKRDKKEKQEISRVFSSQLRSREKGGPPSDRRATSTPHTDRSDITIKFTDHHHDQLLQDQDISKIQPDNILPDSGT